MIDLGYNQAVNLFHTVLTVNEFDSLLSIDEKLTSVVVNLIMKISIERG